MGVTKIEWCDYVFNPWYGCTKVSPACDNCYAESWAKRSGLVKWGNNPRRRTGESYWKQPIKWNRAACASGVRHKVFCASLADVFDNQADPTWRADLFTLIDHTPWLDWLLLTKRPQNIVTMLPEFSVATWDIGARDWADTPAYRTNVWLGTTVENQAEADRRIPHLLAVPAKIKFLSCEPLLGPIRFQDVPGFNRVSLSLSNWWIISGGESGPHARPPMIEWARSIRDQCAIARVPFFWKQWGEYAPDDPTASHTAMRRVGKKAAGALLDGREHKEFPI